MNDGRTTNLMIRLVPPYFLCTSSLNTVDITVSRTRKSGFQLYKAKKHCPYPFENARSTSPSWHQLHTHSNLSEGK
jgi:hypothetical protein